MAQPSFFSELPALVTPDRLPDWKAWTRFRVISSMAPYLSQDFVEENFLKSEALEKLGEFRPHIGYPTKWRGLFWTGDPGRRPGLHLRR